MLNVCSSKKFDGHFENVCYHNAKELLFDCALLSLKRSPKSNVPPRLKVTLIFQGRIIISLWCTSESNSGPYTPRRRGVKTLGCFSTKKSCIIDRRFFLHFRNRRFQDFEFPCFVNFKLYFVSDSEAQWVM